MLSEKHFKCLNKADGQLQYCCCGNISDDYIYVYLNRLHGHHITHNNREIDYTSSDVRIFPFWESCRRTSKPSKRLQSHISFILQIWRGLTTFYTTDFVNKFWNRGRNCFTGQGVSGSNEESMKGKVPPKRSKESEPFGEGPRLTLSLKETKGLRTKD